MSRVLVLGGTKFVGRAIVDEALRRGHDVTLVHRGQTNPHLFSTATHVLGDRTEHMPELERANWDVCVDVSGYTPEQVIPLAQRLRPRVGHYVFISTISVYADLAAPRVEGDPLHRPEDPDAVEPWIAYGARKVLCEDAILAEYGASCTIVRPGYIIGAHDHTARFPWWIHHAARGGRLIVPASMARRIQAIDARDLADFTLSLAASATEGIYNATGPEPPSGLVPYLAEAAKQAGTELEPLVVDDALLGEHTDDLPLWPGSDPAWSAWADVDVSRALAAGLRFRPIADTVSATLAHTGIAAGVGPDETTLRELVARFGNTPGAAAV